MTMFPSEEAPVGRHVSSKHQATEAFESSPEASGSDSEIAEWFRKHEEILIQALAELAND